MSLHPELFALAFDAGLGAKNSLGFGCIEVWEGKKTLTTKTKNVKNRL
jgi:CRISPR/Cas system endoribonuclease Cas6 (RAMP superfamily)